VRRTLADGLDDFARSVLSQHVALRVVFDA
jgi:hypothetical protein